MPAPPAPQASAPLEVSAPLAPQKPAPQKPAPQKPAPLALQKPAPLAPQMPAPPAPQASAPLAPLEASAPLAPQASAPLAPQASAPLAPQASAPFAPQASAPFAPQASTGTPAARATVFRPAASAAAREHAPKQAAREHAPKQAAREHAPKQAASKYNAAKANDAREYDTSFATSTGNTIYMMAQLGAGFRLEMYEHRLDAVCAWQRGDATMYGQVINASFGSYNLFPVGDLLSTSLLAMRHKPPLDYLSVLTLATALNAIAARFDTAARNTRTIDHLMQAFIASATGAAPQHDQVPTGWSSCIVAWASGGDTSYSGVVRIMRSRGVIE
jgi:hypothetical protein